MAGAMKMQKATKMQAPRVNKTQSAKPAAAAPKPKYKIEKSMGQYYYKTGGGTDAKGTKFTNWMPWDNVNKRPKYAPGTAPTGKSSGSSTRSSSSRSDDRGRVKPVSTPVITPTATAIMPSGTMTL